MRSEAPAAARYRYDVAGWGSGEIVLQGEVLLAHDFPAGSASAPVPGLPGPLGLPATPGLPTTPGGETSPPEITLADARAPDCADFVSDLIARFRRQLDGRPVSYADVAVDLSWCTSFQTELAGALRSVPWGEIVSYGELAALAGRPGAARAAGAFCARNRFSFVFPCHRVVGAGGIGGYGESGVELKRRLLALEGVAA